MNYLEQLKQEKTELENQSSEITQKIYQTRHLQNFNNDKVRELNYVKAYLSKYESDPVLSQMNTDVLQIIKQSEALCSQYELESDNLYETRRNLENNNNHKIRLLDNKIRIMEFNNITSDIIEDCFFLFSPSTITIYNGRKRERIFTISDKEIKLTIADGNFTPSNFSCDRIINNLDKSKIQREMYFLRPSETSRKASKVFEWCFEKRENLETQIHFAVLDLDTNMKTEWTIADNDQNAKVTMFTYDPKNYRFTALAKLPEVPKDSLKENIFNVIS